MALWSQATTVVGQIYVTNAFANTIGKYDLDGSVVSDSLVTGLSFPFDIAVFSDNIYVANLDTGVVGTNIPPMERPWTLHSSQGFPV